MIRRRIFFQKTNAARDTSQILFLAEQGGIQMVRLDFPADRTTLIARVDGELDLHAAQQFRECIDTALDANRVRSLLLDFRGVSFIDSSGLGAILGRYKKVSQLRGKMALIHVKPQVKRILEFSGVLGLVNVFESEAKALQNI